MTGKVDPPQGKHYSESQSNLLLVIIASPDLQQSISLRLPREVLNKIRTLADEQDIPYQSLIKLWLAEKVKKAS